METFFCKTKILSGAGSVAALKDMQIQTLLLVSDPFFVKNGTAQQIANLTGARKVQIFDKIQPDPSVALAAEGTAVVQALKPDTVVILGGGSAMDCGKAMAYFSGSGPRIIAIPTTSGSGSEVTDFAILTHGAVKHPLVDAKLQPDVAILDGDLLKELPPKLIADTGFDVLSHALEACAATGAGAITDALAADAFATVFLRLPESYGGKTHVRQAIHNAATMAGLAFSQAGLGLCHAMAHSLGGAFHLPHGRLNAMLLPAVITCNAPAAAGKYAHMARAAGMGAAAEAMGVRNLKNGLIRLRKELQMPATLAQAGIDPRSVREQANAIIQAAYNDPCCHTNPVPVTENMVRQVLEEVTGRG